MENHTKQLNEPKQINKVISAGLIAALYTALSVILAPLSFGSVQIRFSEALTLLPVFGGISSIWGVTIGCFLTNLYGVMTSSSILGVLDIIVGTIATLIAAFLSYKTRNVKTFGMPVLASLMPVFANAFAIGYLFSIMGGSFNLPMFITSFISIFAGEFISCTVIGLFLVKLIEKRGLTKYFKN